MARSRPKSLTCANSGNGIQNIITGPGHQNVNNASVLPPSYPADPNHTDQHHLTENIQPLRHTQSIGILLSGLRYSQDDITRSMFDTPNAPFEQTRVLDLRLDTQRGLSLGTWRQAIGFLLNWLPSLHRQDSQGLTALHHAVKNQSRFALYITLDLLENHPHALGLIVNLAIDLFTLLNTPDFTGQTAAHLAVLQGDRYSFKLLAEKGTNLKLPDKQGQTILHLASQKGHVDMVKYVLYKGATLNEQDLRGFTALHHAVINGHHDVARVLLGAGAKRDVKEDCYDWTALHYAVFTKRLRMVKVLIRRLHDEAEDNPNLDIGDHQGQTALHLASHLQGGPTEHQIASDMVSVLVRAGSTLNVTDGKGRTPLMCAAERANLAAVESLLDKGADVDVWDGREVKSGVKNRRAYDYAMDLAPRGKERDEVLKILSRRHGGDWTDAGGLSGGLCIAGQQDG